MQRTHVRIILKAHGKRTVSEVFETPGTGDMWVVFESTAHTEHPYGIVQLKSLGEPAEWELGTVDVSRLKAIKGSYLMRPIKIFKDYTPCTLQHLMENTMLSTNFDSTGWEP